MLAAIFMLCLVPAPQPAVAPFPLVGTWQCQWGGCNQGMRFRADETYHSPEFGGGIFRVMTLDYTDGEISVEFKEGATWYVMTLAPDGTGHGARMEIDDENRRTYSGRVVVRLKRSRP